MFFVCSSISAVNLFLSFWQLNITRLCAESAVLGGCNELAGDYTGGETPDPIPNSEAKPAGPMIVFTGESRLLPAFTGPARENVSALPFF